MPTPAARLGGMSRIDRHHRTTPFLGFVPDKTFELSERPGVNAPLCFGLTTHLRALANIFQVFHHDRPTRFDQLDNLSGENVIAITTETSLPVTRPTQMPFGAPCALCLQ